MWSTGLRCRLRSTPEQSLIRAAGLAPRRFSFCSSRLDEASDASLRQSSPPVEEAEAGPSTRPDADQPPPHLPLPPPLPYSPTSKPFLRHVQILDQSILSRSPEHSWEIFSGLHPDLHSSVPVGTISNLIRCQSGSQGGKARSTRISQLLQIIRSNEIRLRTSELERAVQHLLDDVKRQTVSLETLNNAMMLLVQSSGGRPERIDPTLRLNWFKAAHTARTVQLYESETFPGHGEEEMRSWIVEQAEKGYLRNVELEGTLLRYRTKVPLIGRRLKRSLELAAVLMKDGKALVEQASSHLIAQHLLGRAKSIRMGSNKGNEAIVEFLDWLRRLNRSELADRIWREALMKSTGGVMEVAWLLSVPEEELDRPKSDSSEQDLRRAQSTVTHALGIIRAKDPEQLDQVRQAAAVACIVVDKVCAARQPLSPSFAHSLFRLLSTRPQGGISDVRFYDVRKAILHVVRRLADDATYLESLAPSSQRNIVKALIRFADKANVVAVLERVYPRLTRQGPRGYSWEWESSAQADMERLIQAATANTPFGLSLATLAYAHWLSSGMIGLEDVERSILQALRDLDDETTAIRLRVILRNEKSTVAARAELTRLVRRAIVENPSDAVTRIYGEIVEQNERAVRRHARLTQAESASNGAESHTAGVQNHEAEEEPKAATG
jgi:hypothetical protein